MFKKYIMLGTTIPNLMTLLVADISFLTIPKALLSRENFMLISSVWEFTHLLKDPEGNVQKGYSKKVAKVEGLGIKIILESIYQNLTRKAYYLRSVQMNSTQENITQILAIKEKQIIIFLFDFFKQSISAAGKSTKNIEANIISKNKVKLSIKVLHF